MKIKIISAVAFSVLLFSCGNQNNGFDVTESGLSYKFFKKNEGAVKPKIGDFLEVQMVNKVSNNGKDSVVYDSRLVSNKPQGVVLYQLLEPKFKGSLEEGILMMGVGDSASFLMNTDSIMKYFFGKEDSAIFPKGSIMTFDVKLVSIKSEEEMKKEQAKMQEEKMKQMAEMIEARKQQEPEELAEYLKLKNIKVQPDKNGLYYIEKEKGSGASAKNGDIAAVKYTGSFLSGEVFDTSDRMGGQPIEFKVGGKEVIEGWELTILKMKKGSKATVIIPSALAYGERGAQDPRSGQFMILPYTPLVFEVELVDIKKE